MLPPVSVPISKGVHFAAIAAAAPPLLPPEVLDRSYGLFVFPNRRLSVLKDKVHSGVLVLPKIIAPSCLNLAVQVASLLGRKSFLPKVPQVVVMSNVSRRSFMVIGTPKSFPGVSPLASAISARSACFKAASALTLIIAFIFGLTMLIRSRKARITSFVLTRFKRMADAISRTLLSISSFIQALCGKSGGGVTLIQIFWMVRLTVSPSMRN